MSSSRPPRYPTASDLGAWRGLRPTRPLCSKDVDQIEPEWVGPRNNTPSPCHAPPRPGYWWAAWRKCSSVRPLAMSARTRCRCEWVWEELPPSHSRQEDVHAFLGSIGTFTCASLTAASRAAGRRESLLYEGLSRDPSTVNAGFTRPVGGQSRRLSCRPDGREATARVRSCSRRGRLAMRSGFSDRAQPAAQP